jgi:hypothetical protein
MPLWAPPEFFLLAARWPNRAIGLRGMLTTLDDAPQTSLVLDTVLISSH